MLKRGMVVLVALILSCFVQAQPRGGVSGFAIARNRGEHGGAEVGDLVVFDLAAPSEGRVVGHTGLTDVGSMDFWGAELWVATFRDDKLEFHVVDIETAAATPRSTVPGRYYGVSGGGFDDQGRYWLVELSEKKLLGIDPRTGTILTQIGIPRSAGYNGLAFAGNRLYALRGGTGDPPQEFGVLDTVSGEFTSIGFTNVGAAGKGGGNGCGALDFEPSSRTLFGVYRQGVEPNQRWSLYTFDASTGQATFVGEIQPRATYDAFAVAPASGTRR